MIAGCGLCYQIIIFEIRYTFLSCFLYLSMNNNMLEIVEQEIVEGLEVVIEIEDMEIAHETEDVAQGHVIDTDQGHESGVGDQGQEKGIIIGLDPAVETGEGEEVDKIKILNPSSARYT